jgi:AcrR family transcriptional regulator
MKNADPLTDLLWNGLAQPKRGPRPTLSLPLIAGAGIELADEGGLPAVTMEAVAQRLGLTKMALYRYVPGKAELVALMVEAGVGVPSFSARAKGWRAMLRAWSHALFEKFSEHRWALEATLGVRPMGPNEVAWLESALAALAGTPLRGADKLDTVVTLIGHVRHLVQQAGPTDSERAFLDSMRALTEGRADSFPALTAVLNERAPKHSEGGALDFGLDRILDGVEALIAGDKTRHKPRS